MIKYGDGFVKFNLFAKKESNAIKWIENNVKLTISSSNYIGKFSFKYAPYLRDVVEDFFNPNVRELVLKFSAQTGKSTLLNALIFYILTQRPSSIMFVFPTVELSQKYFQTKFSPMMEEIDELREVRRGNMVKTGVKSGTQSGGNVRTFNNGSNLIIIGAKSSSSLQSHSIKYLFMDELSEFDDMNRVEMAKNRTKGFELEYKHIMASTPKGNNCLITQEYNNSSKAIYKVPCPYCKFSQSLKINNLIYNKSLNEVVYKCFKCKKMIRETSKLSMIGKGEWVHKKKSDKIKGYNISALYSSFGSWGRMYDNWIKAQQDEIKKEIFYNYDLAESYESPSEYQNDIDGLLKNRKDYTKVPKKVKYISLAIDVQENRCEYEVMGWGVGLENWGIELGIIDCGAKDKGLKNRLDDLINSTFNRSDGKVMNIDVCGIDVNYNKDILLDMLDEIGWYRKTKKASEIVRYGDLYGIVGEDSIKGGDTVIESKKDKYILRVNTTKIKSILRPTFKSNYKADYLKPHFPKTDFYNEGFFQQLYSESPVTKLGTSTVIGWRKNSSSIRNERLDIRVYSYALIIFHAKEELLTGNTLK